MAYARQTVERRQLGLALRRYREMADKSRAEAAQHVGHVYSQINKVEDGLATLSPEKLERLIAFYNIQGDERDTILALGIEARKRTPRRAYVDLLPDSFQRLADLEAAARRIYCYESGLIPGLLQSPSYVKAIIRAGENVWWDSSDAISNDRTTFRLRRQQNTWESDPPKRLHFIVGEAALDETVGSAEVMTEQFEHLLSLMYSRDNVIIQIVPRNAVSNPARGGGFTLLEFDGKVPPVGLIGTLIDPSMYYDEKKHTATILRVFQRLSEISLGLKDTREVITQKLEECQHGSTKTHRVAKE